MKNNHSMLQGPLAWNLLAYTIPIILTSVLQLLFNAADLVVVGRLCGSVSVAAVGSTGSLTSLVVNLFVGLSIGAGVAVAHAIGSREQETVHRTVHTALPTAIICGVFLTVVGVVVSEPMLRLMSTPENVLPLSAIYLKIYFLGMTFTMIYNFCTAILRAAGDTKSPLIILSVAGVVNVALNLFFVVVWDMNVAGVAWATTISQALSAAAVMIVLTRRTDSCRLELGKMKIYPQQLQKILRIGVPAGIQGCLFSISNVIIQASVNSFGDLMMSANAASANIEGFTYVTVNAFQQTAVNYTGQNAGARQFDRVKRIALLCMGYACIAGALTGGFSNLFAKQLLGIYITDSPEAIALGARRLMLTSLPYFIFAAMDCSSGVMRGLGASMETMIITVLGVCGTRIGMIYTIFRMPQFHTMEVLFLAYPISWLITLVVQSIVLVRVYRKQANMA